MNTPRLTFDIRNFSDRLIPSQEKNKYICPACTGKNLSIKPENGKYQCFNGCDNRDVREGVRPWAEVVGDRENNTQMAHTRIPTPSTKKVFAVPLPLGDLKIAPLSNIPTDIPQLVPIKIEDLTKQGKGIIHGVKRDLQSKGVTVEELADLQQITYEYGDNKFAQRYQAPNQNSSKGYSKTFRIKHIDELGKEWWKKGDAPWDAYRQSEAITAMKSVQDEIPVLLFHEGEKCVEAIRAYGLASITSVGNPTEIDLVHIFTNIKQKMGDQRFVVAYLCDNDNTGLKKGEKIAKNCAVASVPVVIIDLKTIYPNLCDNGDVVDILATGMTGDELVQLILKEIQYRQLEEHSYEEDAEESNKDEPIIVKGFCQMAFETLYGDKPWICASNKLYCRNTNYYEYIPDAVEIKRIRDFCDSYAVQKKNIITFPYANPASVTQVLNWVKMTLRIDARLLNPPGVNCTNGVLQVHWDEDKPSFKLAEHSPEFYYTYKPIATYDPSADPKHCDRLLEALEPAQREIFLRTIAASLDLKKVRQYKGRSIRALLLKGDGSNGKDSLREVVALMYGKQGMTNCTLADFAAYDEGRKFSLAPLIISRINWASENANSVRLDKIQSLKAFITGDPLISERKGVDGEEYEPAGIAIFNVNDVPTMQGAMEAILSRYGILEFTKTFKIGANQSLGELEADPRFKYDPMFMQLMVVPAFLNRVLQALFDLMRDGIDYSCTKEALEEIQAENCHLWQFCQDVGLTYSPNSTVTASEIWSKLEAWYQDNGILTYDGTKAVWAEQVRPSDKNVKASHQVISRFLQLFPKAKRVMMPRPGGGKAIAAIAGIGFVSSPDKRVSISGVHNPTREESNPPVTLPVTLQRTENQGFVTPVTLKTPPATPPAGEKQNLSDINSNTNVEFSSGDTKSPSVGLQGLRDEAGLGFEGLRDRVTGGLQDDLVGLRDGVIENKVALKPLAFNLEPGDHIRCYPTLSHAHREWQIIAKVTSVYSEQGWFAGCTVEYRDRKKELVAIHIPGGSADWILSQV